MQSYISGIGKKIREIRKEKNLYASEIARRAEVSNGLMSRIENGRTIPSLPVLLAIFRALEVDPGSFFNSVMPNGFFKYAVIKPDEYETIEKEDDVNGFQYELILTKDLKTIGLEVVLLTLEPGCTRNTVETDAFEMKYIISGKCDYEIDGEILKLEAGDTLFFDGRLPHVPKNPYKEPSKMLVFYLFTE